LPSSLGRLGGRPASAASLATSGSERPLADNHAREKSLQGRIALPWFARLSAVRPSRVKSTASMVLVERRQPWEKSQRGLPMRYFPGPRCVSCPATVGAPLASNRRISHSAGGKPFRCGNDCAEVSFGSKAAFWTSANDFRSTLNNGPRRNAGVSPFGAKERHRLDHHPSAQVAGIVN
jgi:hypothetical protein